MSRYQKGKTSEWQWHQLGHMQAYTSLQTDNHASTPPLKFSTGRMPFLPPNQQRQSTEGTIQLRPLHPKPPSCLASFKSRLVRYLLTQVVLEKRPSNGCSIVVVVIILLLCLGEVLRSPWLRISVSVHSRVCKTAVHTSRDSHVARSSSEQHGAPPTTYLADLPGRRSLRSARTNRLLVPSVKLSTVSGRAFPVAGPTIWNSLLDSLISAPSLPVASLSV